jgi:hypothetical protein
MEPEEAGVVEGKVGEGKEVVPVILEVGAKNADALLDDLVSTLRLTICWGWRAVESLRDVPVRDMRCS